MSKYTTEIRFICENYAGLTESQGYANINDIINKASPKVFDFDFPIFDEGYRATLENKILKHYYTREIGFETVGLWKHFLDMRLNEIMPYYNQLYRSETLEFNPFYDFDYTTKADRNIDHNEQTTNHNTRTDNLDEATTGSSTRTDDLNEATTSQNTRTDNLTEQNNSNAMRTDNLTEVADSTGKRTDNLAHHDQTTTDTQHIDKYSDTPQGALTNVENDTYLTNARMMTDAVNEINDGTNTGTVDTSGKTTTTNTGTQSNDIDTTTTNTGTQSNNGSGNKANTGTQTVESSGDKKNTGTQDNDGNGTRTFKSTDDFLEHVAGKRNGQSYSRLLNEYRETFLNIDKMIIDELSDLFMNLW